MVGRSAKGGVEKSRGWLGFHAMAGLIAVITAILGAVVGANLVLILLDIVRAGSPDDRVASDTATNTRTTGVKLEVLTGAGRR